MKIAIIGTGSVGGTLGRRWARGGHDVTFGSRRPDSAKVRALLDEAGGNAKAASVREAAANADIVVLATPWDATADAIESAGDLTDKIVVDCTNPVAPNLAGLSIGHTLSAGEQVGAWATGARVVKAFNTAGSGTMADPSFNGQAAAMFICGDDTEAKSAVGRLAAELGFDVVDTGALATARYLEPMAMLWIQLAYGQGLGRDFAFKIVKR